MARQHSTPLLQLPHHGWSRNDLHRRHGGRRVPALAQALVRGEMDVMDRHAQFSFSIHRKHGWMAYGGTGKTAVARLWVDEDGYRLLSQSVCRQRSLYVVGLYGDLFGAFHFVYPARVARRESRSGW